MTTNEEESLKSTDLGPSNEQRGKGGGEASLILHYQQPVSVGWVPSRLWSGLGDAQTITGLGITTGRKKGFKPVAAAQPRGQNYLPTSRSRSRSLG